MSEVVIKVMKFEGSTTDDDGNEASITFIEDLQTFLDLPDDAEIPVQILDEKTGEFFESKVKKSNIVLSLFREHQEEGAEPDWLQGTETSLFKDK